VKRFTLGLILILFALSLSAQEAQPAPRRVMLFFEQYVHPDFNDQVSLLFYETLRLKLGTASETVVVVEFKEATVPDNEEDRSEAARAQRADSWVSVRLSGGKDALTLETAGFDLIASALVFEYTLEKPLERGSRDLERRFWNEIADSVREHFWQGGKRIAQAAVRGEVTVVAAPKTKVYGLTRKPVKVGEEGRIGVEILVPTTVELKAYRRGFWPAKQQFFVESPDQVITLDQERGARMALDFYLKNFQFPGFSFSYYIIPNYLYARVGLMSYLLGLNLNDDQRWGGLIISRPLNHLHLSLGLYLGRADRNFRWYTSLGLFTRIITALQYGIAFEPIAPIGVQPLIGLEYSRNMRRRWYLEYAPLWYFTDNPLMMLASFPPGYEPTGYLFPGYAPITIGKLSINYGVIEMLNFQIGLRIQL